MRIHLFCLIGMLIALRGYGFSADEVSVPAVLDLWSETTAG